MEKIKSPEQIVERLEEKRKLLNSVMPYVEKPIGLVIL